jgi:hypothetical protein
MFQRPIGDIANVDNRRCLYYRDSGAAAGTFCRFTTNKVQARVPAVGLGLA